MTTPQQLPREALELLKATGFDNLFWQKLREAKTQAEAYEQAEKEYHSYFQKNKYSSFDSYRKSRDRRFKRK